HDPELMTGMPAPRTDDFEAIARGAGYDADPSVAARRAYTSSKFCNVLCAYQLARRLGPAPKVTVNGFDPGLMPRTGLAREYGSIARFAWTYLLPVLGVLMHDVSSKKRSGRALARLVADPSLEGVTGKHFRIEREVHSSSDSYDEARALSLWATSARLVEA